MFLVGLTGGIASGKSSVIQVFQQLGCAVIDVDVLARLVVQPGCPAHRRIVEAFGTEVLLENGDIDRKVLGDLIFNQPDRRHLLNTITHPEIFKEMVKETFKYFLRGYRYVILDIPLLFETKKLLKYMKHTVVVYCDWDTQLARLMQRNNLNREDAEARIKAQLPLKDKARMAHHVLDNSGEWSVTKRQLDPQGQEFSGLHLLRGWNQVTNASCLLPAQHTHSESELEPCAGSPFLGVHRVPGRETALCFSFPPSPGSLLLEPPISVHEGV
ncbi:dephospho-CoA kinase domain-containing protein isoform X1 [Camelus dromedarius]|uniref:dephospho-CoA kinase domain-containing protein isoform X1 n=1 Tax=Camelus dromedarius TaxID=9838 RepID=UPI003119A2B2